MFFTASKKMLSKKKTETVACEPSTPAIEVEAFIEKLRISEDPTEKQVTSNQTSVLASNGTTQVSGDRIRTSTQSRKRRRNYTEVDNQNILHLYYDMGLTYREIYHITGMCMGSIQLRVKKERKKFPEKRRNVEITDEFIEQLKELCIHNERIDQLQARR
ncbi:hypothetical protein A0J61_11790 [Choanephora cucurbitarum]|uniref:Uncharacterized protein n=1 Tax=Choanephora cucurbitarum TaxID=101091 RepID=A0A1C7MTG4_9FUNG|nr:hypothetical protein A0J61_11790 [Choanephora cucurbitarum]